MPDVVPALKSLVCLSLRIIKPCFLSDSILALHEIEGKL